jgi:hypothetical protein
LRSQSRSPTEFLKIKRRTVHVCVEV